jgi:hypothetical protein
LDCSQNLRIIAPSATLHASLIHKSYIFKIWSKKIWRGELNAFILVMLVWHVNTMSHSSTKKKCTDSRLRFLSNIVALITYKTIAARTCNVTSK